MKSIRTSGGLFAALLILGASLAQAESSLRFEARPGSKLTIDGSSTIHDWSVETQILGGFVEFDQAYFDKLVAGSGQELVGKTVQPKVEVVILTRSIKSGKKTMDSVMHNAMKQQQHPKIEYKVKELTLKEAPKSAAGPYLFDSKGDLQVAGTTKPVVMTVSMEKVVDGKLKFSGKTPLKMTDFGIKPPAPEIALGLIKTADDVTVSFDWVTEQAGGAKTAKN